MNGARAKQLRRAAGWNPQTGDRNLYYSRKMKPRSGVFWWLARLILRILPWTPGWAQAPYREAWRDSTWYSNPSRRRYRELKRQWKKLSHLRRKKIVLRSRGIARQRINELKETAE